MRLAHRFQLSELTILFLLAAVQFTHIMDFMIMMPLAPQLMRELAITPAQFSELIAAYTVLSGGVGLICAPFMDRFDRRTILITAYVGFILGTWGCAVSETASHLIVARAICGAFGGISNATILAIVADLVPPHRRGAAMGIIMTSFSAAAAFGVPFGLYLAQQFRWEAPFYVLVGISTLVEIALFLFLPHVRGHLQEGPPPSLKNFVELLRNGNAWSGLLLVVSLVFGHFTIIPFLSPHLVFNLKLPEKYLAFVYILGGIATIITAPRIGKLSDRFGRVRVFTCLLSCAVVVIGVLTNAGPAPVPVILFLTVVFFIFASGRYVPAQAVLSSAVHASQRGAYMSLTACTRDLCTGLAAIAAGHIVVRTDDRLQNVHLLGWIAILVSIASMLFIRQVRAVDEPVVPQPAVEPV